MCFKTFLSSGLDSYLPCYVTVILGTAASHANRPTRHVAKRTRRMPAETAATAVHPRRQLQLHT
jgi:hypothetical protein